MVPTGQDDLLAAMFGRGEVLPGECRWLRGEGDRRVVRTAYGCPGGEVVFELRHPDDAPEAVMRTRKFALVLLTGTPPPGLADSLLARIGEREAGFEWAWIGPPPPGYSRQVVLVAAFLLVLLALWAFLRRRRVDS